MCVTDREGEREKVRWGCYMGGVEVYLSADMFTILFPCNNCLPLPFCLSVDLEQTRAYQVSTAEKGTEGEEALAPFTQRL